MMDASYLSSHSRENKGLMEATRQLYPCMCDSSGTVVFKSCLCKHQAASGRLCLGAHLQWTDAFPVRSSLDKSRNASASDLKETDEAMEPNQC